jgi:hypothetical protein
MAWSLVQSRQQTGGGTTSTARAFASNVVAGNILIAAISAGGLVGSVPVSSVTDSQGNTWNQVGTATQAPAGDYIQIFYAIAGSSAANTVTANFPGSSQGDTLTIFEFSGNGTTLASLLNTSSSNSGTSNAPAAGAVTPSADGCLFFAAEVDSANDAVTITAGTDFTIQQTQLTSSTLERIGTESYAQPTAVSHNGNFTLGSSVSWACKLAVFNPPITAVIQDLIDENGILPFER